MSLSTLCLSGIHWLRAALLPALFAASASQAAYVQVFSTIEKGALTFTGNTLVLQSTTAAGSGGAYIAVGQSGSAAGYPAGTTTNFALNGSSAVLSVPPGATVLYAELIWSGTIGTNSAATLNGNVNFTTPSGTYSMASSTTTAGSSGTYYTRSANVSGLVQIAGSGSYTVGGVPGKASSASTDGAGWTLAVAYADPSQVARNLTLFVGAEQSGAAAATVSGFCTPVAGLVNGRLLVSAIEGDASVVGDTMLFGPSTPLGTANRLSGPNNLLTNFFASQINGGNGTLDSSGSFGSVNQPPGGNTSFARQGYDITNVDVSSFLTNAQTTAAAQGTTTGDSYAINALALQIDVTSPVFPTTVKTVNKTSTFVGDTLRYSIDLDNTAGNGAANGVVFYDSIPAGMALVANSVRVNGMVVNGANPAAGVAIGNVAVGGLTTISFDVQVLSLPASPAAARFSNTARWDYTYYACAGVVAQPGSVTTQPALTPVARLEPVKTVSPSGALVGGQMVTYTVAMPNTGLLATAGTTLADPLPAGTTYVAGSTRLNGVTVADLPGGLMPYASAAAVNSAGRSAGIIGVGETATVQFSVAATGNGTVLNTATIDPDGAGPGTAITVSAVNSGLAGPAVAKAFAPASIGAGSSSTLTITLSNPNASAITGISLTDNLPAGMVLAASPNASTTCTGGTVAATAGNSALSLSGATVPASGSCSVSASVTVASAGSYTNTIPAAAVSSNNAGLSSAGSQTLVVTAPPALAKSFSPGTVAPNASATLTIKLSNPSASVMTGATLTDIFPTTTSGAPGNMVLFDLVSSNTCGGSLSTSSGAALAVGSASVKLTGGSIPANDVCTITVNVKAPTGGSYVNELAAGSLTSSGGSNASRVAATLQIASPQVAKAFAASAVAANAATAMTITLTNVTSAAISGLAFTDTYPVGLVNSSTTVTNTGCAGTATASATATNPGTLTLSAGTLAAGASCSLSVNVQSATPGSYTNSLAAGAVASSIGTNASGASATLNVARPDISKNFTAVTVPLGGTTPLTITLGNSTASAMTGAAFTDSLPAGLSASAAGGTCAGTKTASGGSVSLSGGTIPAAGSCTVTATITGTSVGLKTNTIAVGGLTVTGPSASSNGTAATDSLTVLAVPTIAKSFLTSPILPGSGISTLRIVLSNSNPTALTSAAFSDVFPTSPGAMTLASLSTTNSCSGSLVSNTGAALAIGATGIQLSGGTIPSNGSCTVTVEVKASAAGDYLNTIPASPTSGALATANGGGNASATSDTLVVRLAAPTLVKAFSPSTVVANSATTLTLTLSNPSTTTAITGVSLSDVFPAGMKVYDSPLFSNSCGGSVSPGSTAADTSISLSGASIPFNGGGTGSCSISVQVTSSITAASPGLTNTTSSVTSVNANTGSAASANLIITAPPLTAPTIAKAFSPATIGVGDVSTIVFTLGSANTSVLNDANFTDSLNNMAVASTSITGTCTSVSNSPALVVGATGSNALNLTVPNLPPGGCTVHVQVSSSTLGANPNSVSGVTTLTTPAAGAGAGPVVLTVVDKPTIAKAFSPASIVAGATSRITFSLGNSHTSALSNASFTDTLVNMSLTSTTIGGSCVGTSASPALTVGATALNLSMPSLPAGGCTVTVDVTSSVVGTQPNTSSGVTTTQTSVGSASNTASLTVSAAPPSGVAVSGRVYQDSNHNLQADSGEAGTGLVLYAKLLATASGTASQAVAVDPSTGAYAFSAVLAGNYTVLVDNNATLADISPTLPPGWVGTSPPELQRSNLQVAGSDMTEINFGLFAGSRLTGLVFADTGSGGGSAHNSLRDGSEAAVAGSALRLTDASGATVYDSSVSAADGRYTLWIPAALGAVTLKVVQTNLSGMLSSGGAAGTTAGSYDRSSDTLSFSHQPGVSFSGVNFADVPAPRFAANGQQSGQPGGVVFHPHQFDAGSAGSVSFGTSSTSLWPLQLLRDDNCNGLPDAGETNLPASVALLVGERLCLLAKLSIPAGAPQGAQDLLTLQASFSHLNASPALVSSLSLTDTTVVGQAGAALVLRKGADKASALAGELISYTLSYQNNGQTPLGAIRISDNTPAYTSFVSSSCVAPPPSGLSCTVLTAPAPGAVGALQWQLSGALAPGASGQVVFTVRVDQ